MRGYTHGYTNTNLRGKYKVVLRGVTVAAAPRSGPVKPCQGMLAPPQKRPPVLTADSRKHLLLHTPREHIKMRLELWQKGTDDEGRLRSDEYPDPQWLVDELLREYPATKATGETEKEIKRNITTYTGFDLSELMSLLAPHQEKLNELQLDDQNEARCATDKSYNNDIAHNSHKAKDQTLCGKRIEATLGEGFLGRWIGKEKNYPEHVFARAGGRKTTEDNTRKYKKITTVHGKVQRNMAHGHARTGRWTEGVVLGMVGLADSTRGQR